MSQVKGIYSDSEVVDCNSGLSNEELSQAIRLQTIDQYIFLIFPIIAFILTMIIMLSFMIYPKTWKMPGDIIFFISFVRPSYVFIGLAHAYTLQQMRVVLQVMIYFAKLIQLQAYLLELEKSPIIQYSVFMQEQLQRINLQQKLRLILHVIAWFTMISVTLIAKILIIMDCLYLALVVQSIILDSILLVCFWFCKYFYVSLYNAVYQKAVPENQRYLNLIGKVTRYYSSYITAQFCIQLTQAISYILVGLNCTKFQKGWLLIFITIENSAKLCTPFVLSILRLRDPTINRQILLIWKRLSSKSEVGSSLLSEEQNLVVIAKTLLIDKVNTIVYSIQQIFQQDNYIENASKVNNQTSEIQSKQIQEIQDKITEEEINEQAQFVIPPEQDLEIELRLMASTIIIYAPKSFDPISNQEQINSFKGPDGGKGGAFFLPLTINFQSKQLLNKNYQQFKNLGRYFLHLNRNESLISPIYGIFKFVLQNGQESQIFIVMRNALQIPSSYVMRTYDLKGSEYQRKVLKQNDFTKDLTKTTLKDIDFKEEEGKLFIPEKFKDRLKTAQFKIPNFSELNLMDYSLLIIKMNWSSYLQIQPQIDIFKFLIQNYLVYHQQKNKGYTTILQLLITYKNGMLKKD